MKLAACAGGFAAFAMLLTTAALFSSVSPAQSAKVARGKYIVEGVGMCGDCHTPHNENGAPILGKTLRGAVLSFKPIMPMPAWADTAPNIAGLPGWSDEQAVKFLMTGVAYNGLPGRPPMPSYRMARQDAEAVVAYLKSLARPDH